MVGIGNLLWDFTSQECITRFGTSVKYLDLIARSGGGRDEQGRAIERCKGELV
jgi:hypothetical protein